MPKSQFFRRRLAAGMIGLLLMQISSNAFAAGGGHGGGQSDAPKKPRSSNTCININEAFGENAREVKLEENECVKHANDHYLLELMVILFGTAILGAAIVATIGECVPLDGVADLGLYCFNPSVKPQDIPGCLAGRITAHIANTPRHAKHALKCAESLRHLAGVAKSAKLEAALVQTGFVKLDTAVLRSVLTSVTRDVAMRSGKSLANKVALPLILADLGGATAKLAATIEMCKYEAAVSRKNIQPLACNRDACTCYSGDDMDRACMSRAECLRINHADPSKCGSVEEAGFVTGIASCKTIKNGVANPLDKGVVSYGLPALFGANNNLPGQKLLKCKSWTNQYEMWGGLSVEVVGGVPTRSKRMCHLQDGRKFELPPPGGYRIVKDGKYHVRSPEDYGKWVRQERLEKYEKEYGTTSDKKTDAEVAK